jgi:hypothetical protein
MLVYTTLWEDVDPGMFSRRIVGGRWKRVDSVRGVGQGTSRERIGSFEGSRQWKVRYCRLRERLRGKKADCLSYGRLEKTTVFRIMTAVSRHDLADTEKCIEEAGRYQ